MGVLLEAKGAGLIGALVPLLDRLQHEFRFYLAPAVRSEVIRLAGESS